MSDHDQQNQEGFSSMEELMQKQNQEKPQAPESPQVQEDVDAQQPVEEESIPQEVLHREQSLAADKAFEQHYQEHYQEAKTEPAEEPAPKETNSEVTQVPRSPEKRNGLSSNENNL